MMRETTATLVRIVRVTSTTSYQSLKKLIEAQLATKNAPGNVLPAGQILEVRLTPSANLIVQDGYTRDDLTVASGDTKIFPAQDALTDLALKNNATVTVEIYIRRA